jgi:hypothetical protein
LLSSVVVLLVSGTGFATQPIGGFARVEVEAFVTAALYFICYDADRSTGVVGVAMADNPLHTLHQRVSGSSLKFAGHGGISFQLL